MQKIETDSFEFALPEGWKHFSEDGRLICIGPADQELQISVKTARNAAGQVSEAILDQIVAAVLATMHRMHADPEVTEVRAPNRETVGDVTCTVATVRTNDNAILFSQVAVRGLAAVMFASLESENSPQHVEDLRRFLNSIKDVASEAVS